MTGRWAVAIALLIGTPALAMIAFFGSATYIAWRVYLPEKGTGYTGLRTDVSDLMAESRVVTVAIVGKCQPGKPDTCGLVPAARLVMQDTGAAVQAVTTQVQQSGVLINAAAKGVDRTTSASTALLGSAKIATDALPVLFGKAGVAIGNVGDLAGSANETADAATGAVGRLNSLMDRPALNDALKRKAIEALLDNLTATSVQVEGVSANLNDATFDFKTRFHQVLYPPKCATKMCTLGKIVLPALREAPMLGETGYWIEEMLNGVPRPVVNVNLPKQ